MNTPHLYKITDLTYRYGNHFTLVVPDLAIDTGSSIGFAGPNGGGKSTLLKLLAFLEAPAEGTIFFEDRNILNSRLNVTRLAGRSPLPHKVRFVSLSLHLREVHTPGTQSIQ